MRVQRSIPIKDSELLELSSTYYDALKDSKLFDNSAAKVLIETLGEMRTKFKGACDDARFRDMLKVAARKQIRKELVTAFKRVIHYIEAMATDDDLKDLQRRGVRLARFGNRKRKSKADQPEVDAASEDD